MSVQTQIDRISGNVSAALSAIADKGVTVPDGSTSDALASLIASIEAGGGAKIITGEFTLSTVASGVSIEHNLGEVPNFAYYFAMLAPSLSNQYNNNPTRFFAIYLDGIHYSYYVSGGMSNKATKYADIAYDISKKVRESDSNGVIYAGNSATNSTIIIGGNPSGYGYFKNNTTYKWGVGVI